MEPDKTYGSIKATKKEIFESIWEFYGEYCKLRAELDGDTKISHPDFEEALVEFQKDALNAN